MKNVMLGALVLIIVSCIMFCIATSQTNGQTNQSTYNYAEERNSIARYEFKIVNNNTGEIKKFVCFQGSNPSYKIEDCAIIIDDPFHPFGSPLGIYDVETYSVEFTRDRVEPYGDVNQYIWDNSGWQSDMAEDSSGGY